MGGEALNIHDIAKLAGYSVATVSRVINDRPYVSQAAREAVLKVMREADYVPNAVARDLSAGKTWAIGVVTPMREHPYFTSLTDSITQAAFAKGYHVVLLPSQYDATVELGYLEQLRRKAYDGLIFTSHAMNAEEMVPYLKYAPVVLCHDPGRLALPAAFTKRGDTYVAGCRWLKAHGAKRVGLFLPRTPALSATAAAMLTAYETVFGFTPPQAWLADDVMSNAAGYQAAAKLAGQGLDGILTNGDDIAAGAVQYYREHHLPCPLLVGQENQLSSRLLNLPTIDHHFHEVGRHALNLAIEAEHGHIAVPSTFIARG